MTNFSEKIFLDQKLNNWIGYILFTAIAFVFGYLIATNFFMGVGLFVAIVGLAIAALCIVSAEAGLYVNLIYSFFISFFNRLWFGGEMQVGIISDLLIALTFLGFIIRKDNLKASINEFAKNKLIVVLFIVYGYMAVELFNPYAAFFFGWFPAFRKILGSLFLLFIAYKVFENPASIKRFVVLLFFLTVIVAIYGCIQQWFGFFEFEVNWLRSDPKRFRMTFLGAGVRRMSTMNDAVSLSIIMAACGTFYMTLLAFQKKIIYKVVLGVGIIFMLMAMSYTVTRTANGMIVGGLLMFMLLTFNKQNTRVFSLIAFVIIILLLVLPIQNAQIDQFRQTFEASSDPSYAVRENNRKTIQPYIYTHPIGGGLGTTGGEGIEFNAGHPLAGFPPDSGYLKKALEMGWIGFIMICVLYFLVLKCGINGYFSTKSEKLKMIYAASTAAIFSFYIGDFTQVAIGQITDIVVYYPFVAILLRQKEFDLSNSETLNLKTIQKNKLLLK